MARLSLLTLLAVLGGCTERPKAPPLVNEAVYQNDSAGLRFLTPEGWTIASRANLPPGPLSRPMMLVSYHLRGNEHPAALELYAVDLPADADVEKFLLDTRIGQGDWKAKTPPQAIAIDGADATRYLFGLQSGKTEHLREFTVFRRGERIYYFLTSFASVDPGSRDTARKSIESVTWTK